jgi:hypothetical protein
MENMAYKYKRKQRQILNQHEQAQNLKMIITEPTKTGTELVPRLHGNDKYIHALND